MNADDGFDEYDLFESEFANQLEVLDELEGNNPSLTQDKVGTEHHSDLPNLKLKSASKRKKLFSPSKNESISTADLFPMEDDADLIIAEDEIANAPQSKRSKLDDILINLNKPNLPTTLDIDRDVEVERLEERKRRECIGTPQILEKIKKYREKRHKTQDFLSSEVLPQNNSSSSFHLTKVLVHPPVNSDSVAVTSSEGHRVYMRIIRGNKQSMNANRLMSGFKPTQLLPLTMTEMRQIIFDEKQYDSVAESRRITEEIRRENILSSTNDILSESALTADDTCNEDEGVYSEEDNSQDGLWVTKYAPTRYTHLLSDESVNRALLRWLKLWDKVVFGRDPPLRKSAPSESHAKQQKFSKKFKKNTDEGFNEELDETNRPTLKTALLCGPPGLGKTTLAHVIAKHAGYHVVEMNASDDRSAEAFQKKLDETTQMKSVLGSEQRPNCLIIDEIDGAPQAAITVLLNALNKTRKSDPKKKKSKKDANSILLRPIICICNDVYVPALRQLRQQSHVLQFPPTTSDKLASRLRQVCCNQGLRCGMTTLLALCEKSGNDIRTCVNTLQFVQSKGKKGLDLETIKNLSIGQKDQHKSIFYVWNELFQQPKDQRKMDRDSQALQHSLAEGQKMTQFSARFYHILNIVVANGEYEKTLQGVHENFLVMKFKDARMKVVNYAMEWLLLYDSLSMETLSHQEWVLMRYIPYLFVNFHLLFSCLSPPRIQFPHKAQENRQKLQRNENILSTLHSEMSPFVRCFTSQTVAVLDVVPYLLAIMTPNLRPVNKQLYSLSEKKQLSDLVLSMLSYNLTYRQERNQEGQFSYVLEPDMGEVCNFTEKENSSRKQLPYAIKQIISKEVEMERMRRSERLMTGRLEGCNKENCNKTEKKMIKPTAIVPNHKKRLESSLKTISVPREKPVVDFFSRFTKIKKVDENGAERASKKLEVNDPGIGNSQLWFRYNEGLTNAVRRKVFVKDFL